MKININKNNFYWINLIWFQVIWFVAIFYTDDATYPLLLSLCAHFLCSPTRKSDLFTVVQVSIIGILADYLLAYLGILNFTDSMFIPLWLILLWCHFAITLNHGMRWLTKLPQYATILFGGVFGTLSYYTGAQMEAVTLHNSLLLSLFSLMMIWGTLLPVYIALASANRIRFDENIKGTT